MPRFRSVTSRCRSAFLHGLRTAAWREPRRAVRHGLRIAAFLAAALALLPAAWAGVPKVVMVEDFTATW